jgi:hypothetical protein
MLKKILNKKVEKVERLEKGWRRLEKVAAP